MKNASEGKHSYFNLTEWRFLPVKEKFKEEDLLGEKELKT